MTGLQPQQPQRSRTRRPPHPPCPADPHRPATRSRPAAAGREPSPGGDSAPASWGLRHSSQPVHTPYPTALTKGVVQMSTNPAPKKIVRAATTVAAASLAVAATAAMSTDTTNGDHRPGPVAQPPSLVAELDTPQGINSHPDSDPAIKQNIRAVTVGPRR